MRGAKQVPYVTPFQKNTVIREERKEGGGGIICFLSESNKITDAKKLASHTSVKRTVKHESMQCILCS
jgi:hypothetical protein